MKCKTKIINKDNHHSIPPSLKFTRSLNYLVRIDESWIYDEKNIIPGWNKLFGLSDGKLINSLKYFFKNIVKGKFKFIPPHHFNSNRIGWRCVEGKIKFCHYCYINKVRYIKEFDNLYKPNTFIIIKVEINPNGYYVSICGESNFVETKRNSNFNWVLNPYFGGRSKSPHKMYFGYIKIK